jgi:hypothetical protein
MKTKKNPAKIAAARRRDVVIDLEPALYSVMQAHCDKLGVVFEHHVAILLALHVGGSEQQVRADYPDFEDLDAILEDIRPAKRPLIQRVMLALRDHADALEASPATDHLIALAEELDAATPALREVWHSLLDGAQCELDEALELPDGDPHRKSGISQHDDLHRLAKGVETLIGEEVSRG